MSYRETFATQNRTEVRNGFISTFNDKDGNAITMGAIADANRTYKNVTLAYKPGQAGTAGAGTVRAHIQTANVLGVETITNMEIIDGGKDFKANEILLIPAGNGNIAGQEITITGVLNGHTHTLTVANTSNTTANATWGAGENGFYDFDASGAPAVGGARLAYSPGQNKLEQVVTKTMVPNPGGVIIDPETGQRTNDVEQTTYSTRIQQVVTGSTYLGETNLTDTVSTGYTPDRTDTVPEYWSIISVSILVKILL